MYSDYNHKIRQNILIHCSGIHIEMQKINNILQIDILRYSLSKLRVF